MPSGRRAAAPLSLLFMLASAVSAFAQREPVVVRDPAGVITVRAVRADGEMRIDGRLDEETYAATDAIGGFVQQEPDEFQPATENTEAWVVFDDRNIYVS